VKERGDTDLQWRRGGELLPGVLGCACSSMLCVGVST
jgi:hypothetical protein